MSSSLIREVYTDSGYLRDSDRTEMNAPQFVRRIPSALQGTELPANTCSLSIVHEEFKLQELSARTTKIEKMTKYGEMDCKPRHLKCKPKFLGCSWWVFSSLQ